MGEVVGVDQVRRAREAATRHFVEWAPAAKTEAMVDSLPEVVRVMDWARQAGDWNTVLTLGGPAEKAASLARRWGLWGGILETSRVAAVQMGNKAAEAHALHQLGTRTRLLGDKKAARKLLKDARKIRRDIGDTAGAELTAHNLGFAKLAWVTWLAVAVIAVIGGTAVLCTATDTCDAPGEFALTPTEVEFGGVAVGGEGGTAEVRIRNTGEGSAALSASILEDTSGAFSVAGTDCPDTLEPGEACSYAFSFDPLEPGEHSATFAVAVEGMGTREARLSGTGLGLEAVVVDLSPASLEFDALPAGGDGTAADVLVVNTGNVPATLGDPVLQGDQAFSVLAADCPQTLEPGAECRYTIGFSPAAPGDFSGTFMLDIQDAEARPVPLFGVGLGEAQLRIEPPDGDFALVGIGDARRIDFEVANEGTQSAELRNIVVDGEFFGLAVNDCGDVVEPGSRCVIGVEFAPERNPEEGLEDLEHGGVLTVTAETGDAIEVPLRAVSSFLLPDLSVELIEATPIGRRLTSGTDVVVVRVLSIIRNTGRSDATGFRVTAERFVDGTWFQVAITQDPAISSFDIVASLGADEAAPLAAFVTVPRSFLDPSVSMLIRLIIDSCAGLEFVPEECEILESDEGNNTSNDLESNPVVAVSEITLERRRSSDDFDYATFRETNLADLVADALAWWGDFIAEERGIEGPIAFLDAGTLIPPANDGRTFIPFGDMTMLDLVDIAPSGVPVLSQSLDRAQVADLFENGASLFGTAAFLHVPRGAQFRWCSNGPPYSIDLVISERALVTGGDPIGGLPVSAITTARTIDGTYGIAIGGFEAVSGSVVEVLRDYLGQALGGVVTDDSITGGRIVDVCVID